MYAPGTAIVVRDVWRTKVWDAAPVVVVRHDAGWLVDHQVPGSVLISRTCRGREKLDALESGRWDLAPVTASEPGLNFYRAGGWSRIGMVWSEDYSSFHGWYVNFQLPLEASRFGFDTMDLVLDARITPSRGWSWKDEDDFADALRRGIFDSDLADSVHAHAEGVQRLMDRREGPFSDEWQHWRPPRPVEVPALPPDATIA